LKRAKTPPGKQVHIELFCEYFESVSTSSSFGRI